jgi:GR25 family glycosyltransferase involved in LPS biosynthesis
VKAYVVNLPAADRRRRFMEKQLADAGLDHEVVTAVNGWDLDAGQRELVDWERFEVDNALSPEAIGCYLSHLDIHARIAAGSDRVGLVLEDDAVLPSGFGGLLEALAPEVEDGEIVLLHYRAGRQEPVRLDADGAASVGGLRLLRATNVVVSSAAYLITQATCREFREHGVPIQHPVDTWQELRRKGALTQVRCAYPRPVDVESSFKSQLGYAGTGLAGRASAIVARHRIFPIHQFLTWRRRRYEQAGSRFEVIPPNSA